MKNLTQHLRVLPILALAFVGVSMSVMVACVPDAGEDNGSSEDSLGYGGYGYGYGSSSGSSGHSSSSGSSGHSSSSGSSGHSSSSGSSGASSSGQ